MEINSDTTRFNIGDTYFHALEPDGFEQGEQCWKVQISAPARIIGSPKIRKMRVSKIIELYEESTAGRIEKETVVTTDYRSKNRISNVHPNGMSRPLREKSVGSRVPSRAEFRAKLLSKMKERAQKLK